MRTIHANGYNLEIGSILESSFSKHLEEFSAAKIFIIVDDNTHEHCLSYLITSFEQLSSAEVVVLPLGEENKQLQIAASVWEALTEYGVSRHDLIVNLGGGLITDIGGFIASCYKRGVEFINIPTTLLGMVDASIGGKTGLNLGHFKNQIGVFNNPRALFIDPIFLGTLPQEQLLSGYAEMIKHGLIHSRQLFLDVMNAMKSESGFTLELMERCIEVKHQVVTEDPLEDGYRKILNFGHTFGHAIEGHYMATGTLTHGHAVAVGMILEAFISQKRGMISAEDYQLVESEILPFYPMPEFSNDDIQEMIALLSNDKKNKEDKVLCCLLKDLGECAYDCELTREEALEAFMHFKNQQINLN